MNGKEKHEKKVEELIQLWLYLLDRYLALGGDYLSDIHDDYLDIKDVAESLGNGGVTVAISVSDDSSYLYVQFSTYGAIASAMGTFSPHYVIELSSIVTDALRKFPNTFTGGNSRRFELTISDDDFLRMWEPLEEIGKVMDL